MFSCFVHNVSVLFEMSGESWLWNGGFGPLGRQVGSGMAVSRPLGRQVGSGMAVLEALGRQVGPGTAVLVALGRQVGPGTAVLGTLGRQVGPGTAFLTQNEPLGPLRSEAPWPNFV